MQGRDQNFSRKGVKNSSYESSWGGVFSLKAFHLNGEEQRGEKIPGGTTSVRVINCTKEGGRLG